jgi:hypothetical protein
MNIVKNNLTLIAQHRAYHSDGSHSISQLQSDDALQVYPATNRVSTARFLIMLTT